MEISADLAYPLSGPTSTHFFVTPLFFSADGLARPKADRLGFLDKRRSVWWVLREEE